MRDKIKRYLKMIKILPDKPQNPKKREKKIISFIDSIFFFISEIIGVKQQQRWLCHIVTCVRQRTTYNTADVKIGHIQWFSFILRCIMNK